MNATVASGQSRFAALKTELLLLLVSFFGIAGTYVATSVLLMALAPQASRRSEALLYGIVARLIAGVVLLLLLVPLRIGISRTFERHQLARICAPGARLGVVDPATQMHVGVWVVGLPFVALIGTLALAFAIAEGAQLVAIGLSVVFHMFAFVYHRVPNGRRSVKYAAFYLGQGLLGGALALRKLSDDDVISAFFFTTLSMIASFIVCAIIIRRARPTEPPTPGERETAYAIAAYQSGMSSGPGPGLATFGWMLLRIIPFLGEIYWAKRIWGKERLARLPVLFLRSFSHAEAGTLLAKLVTPAIATFWPVATVAHRMQPGTRLAKDVHEAWTPTVLSVADDEWQPWFLEQLRACFAVVVDATVLTPSTQWELEATLAMLGRDRVAVLWPADQPVPELIHRFYVIRYARDDVATARVELATWITWLIRTRFLAVPAG